MKALFIIASVLLVCLAGCAPTDYTSEKVTSATGNYYFVASVNRTDQTKENYADVIVNLYTADGKEADEINTYTGDFNKWALGWSATGDTLLLHSSDNGIFAWYPENNKFKLMEVNEALKQRAEQISKLKYPQEN